MRRVVHLIAVLGLASCGGQVAPESGKGKLDLDSSTSPEPDSGVDSGVEFDGGDDSSGGLDRETDSGSEPDSETDSGADGEPDSETDSSDEPDGTTGACPGGALECCLLPQGSGFQCEEDFGPASCSGTCPYGGTPRTTCDALVCVTLPAEAGSD